MASIITVNNSVFNLLINTLNEENSNRNKEYRININKKDKYGRSALYFVVLMNRKEETRVLLNNGATISENIKLLIRNLKCEKDLNKCDKNIIKLIKNKFNDISNSFKNNICKYNPDIERIILAKQNENLSRVLDNMKLNNNSLSFN